MRGMSNPSAAQLSVAIQNARDAGVSDIEIAKAEAKLQRLTRA